MKVHIKNFQVDMEVKNAGLEFQVDDSEGKQLGDLYVTKANLIWCNGKTQKANGEKIKWEDFIAWANERAAKKKEKAKKK